MMDSNSNSNSTSSGSRSAGPGPIANVSTSLRTTTDPLLPKYLLFQNAKDLRGKKRPDNAWNAEQFRRNRWVYRINI